MTSYTTTNRAVGSAFLAFLGGAVVWAVFGDRIKEKLNQNETYRELKDKVMSRVNQLSDMTESRYHQIVDETSGMYAKAKGISQNELQDMVNDLKFHWAKIKDRWNQQPPQQQPPQQKIADSSDQATYNFEDRFKE
ncbi:MAG TPA: hypothetical protein VEC17_00610 [Candidatus Binatia bacterium]|nr:hypothetical protein [Candidatus Binatia bacterium]